MRRSDLFFIALIFLASAAFGGEAVLTWEAPTKNTDGSDYTDPNGYFLHMGPGAGSFPVERYIEDPATLSYTWTGLDEGQRYCWRAQAVNMSGVRSDYTNEVCKTITAAPVPNPPGGLQVWIDTTAYEISEGTNSVALVPIGTVPAGTPCLPSLQIEGLYVVPRDSVVTPSPALPVPEVVVAACAGSGD